ncbi:MAG: hypothetical protein ACOC41_05780 [Chitinivibrionales bacterium]
MKKTAVSITGCILTLTSLIFGASYDPQDIVGGPKGAHPYLFKGVSRNALSSATGIRHPWSLLGRSVGDTAELHIRAILVDFQLDSSSYTTGNGKFGIFEGNQGTRDDVEEYEYYPENGGDEYVYDDLPHDYDYFQRQLDFVRNYYDKVSRGRMKISYSIYPHDGNDRFAYTVPGKMVRYSPGVKRGKESWDEYYNRRTQALMEFVRDALVAADTTDNGNMSPFRGLRDSAGVLIDSLGRRTGILLIHAGASYLTDGGTGGAYEADTPSDMIDAFISTDFFTHFADSIGFQIDSLDANRGGVRPSTNSDILIDEVMMVSETSNQDGLNWGIHGILVNQVARQIGIPDLFSTMSGISGIGAFCIMDFAGYSTANGFIPPWPSAWVRAFMGWDTPTVVDVDDETSVTVKAISAAQAGDTSIVLVPINDHEYYLIENRQRNLTDRDPFIYDTTVDLNGRRPLSPSNHVDLDENVMASGLPNVVDSAVNYDVGLPASGVLVWHIDENVVRDRFELNLLNADSLYRAVSLVEADGVTDLGVEYTSFYSAVYDYGGAQDVFPHRVMDREDEKDFTVRGFGPFTRPSTRSNDGGHTYLELSIPNLPEKTELSYLEGHEYYVNNYVDSVFTLNISRNADAPASPGWPKRMVASSYFEPAICDVYENGDSLELAILDTAGRLYLWQANGTNAYESFGNLKAAITTSLIRLPTDNHTAMVDSVRYLYQIDQPAAMPTTVDGSLFIPSKNGMLYMLHSVDGDHDSTIVEVDSIRLPSPASSYVTNYHEDLWAVGCVNGSVVYGQGSSEGQTVAADSSSDDSPVVALAVSDSETGTLAVMHRNGVLRIITPGAQQPAPSYRIRAGIAPYTLTVADLNPDDDVDQNILISDSRQGLWMAQLTDGQLSTAAGWDRTPNDWAGLTYSPEEKAQKDRTLLPLNGSAPALADVDDNGVIDIVIGGTNGIFVLNERGTLLPPWPSYLDNRYWYQRGTIDASPIVMGAADSLRVLYASPTGERVTFAVSDVDSSDQETGTIYYSLPDNRADSISGLTSSFIDSLMVYGDSVVLPYISPGGFVDALGASAKRPTFTRNTNYTGTIRVSQWPLTTGGSSGASPVVHDIDGDGTTDLFAVTSTGWVYRWNMGEGMLPQSAVWPQAGFSSARTFAFAGAESSGAEETRDKIVHFYNYPNPVKGYDETTFKYQLSNDARGVRMDIYTYTGYHALEEKSLPAFSGWNEYQVSIKDFGPGIYRCRLEVEYRGKTEVKMWKMAIIR